MSSSAYDIAVVGAGPGGYVAAIRSAQLGLKTVCIDENPMPGGTCLRVGCIPSKALLESSERYVQTQSGLKEFGITVENVAFDLSVMMARKQRIVDGLTTGISMLFKKNGIVHIRGRGRLAGTGKIVVDETEGFSTTIAANKILLAPGSISAGLPGITIDHDRVCTSTDALSFDSVPKNLVVIGAGFIGLELGSVWSRLGSKVTVIEYLDRILPGMDAEMAKKALSSLKRQGIKFKLGARVSSAQVIDGQVTVSVDDEAETITADRVLVAVGRRPNTSDLGLDTVGLALDKRGFIPVNSRFETAIPGVFAFGDAIGGMLLAHKASEEGVACVEYIAKGHKEINYLAIPGVCFTEPELAGVGRTEEELTDAGINYKVGRFNYRGNGRAHALGMTDGSAKVLADAETGRILGVHIIGARAGELIAEATIAIEKKVTAAELAATCHAHPTLPEILKEAALDVDNSAIHS